MINEVHDILGKPSASKSSTSTASTSVSTKIPKEVKKRPKNIPREVYNLMTSSDSLIPALTQTGNSYTNKKVQILSKTKKKFLWTPFTNEARTDGLVLYHWRREDKITKPYEFTFFNKALEIPKYTTEEYEQHLVSPKWTKEETDYLFEMCHRFNLRWAIIVDRYDVQTYKNKRTVEDIKERFYSILQELAFLKDPNSQPIAYDADHERRRKDQLSKQFSRTREDVEREENLQNQLKKIETMRKEREKKAQDLQKLLSMVDAPIASPSHSHAGMSPTVSKKKTVARVKNIANTPAAPLFNPSELTVAAIRFSEFKSAGPHLRTQEMKLPTNIGQKKLKNIEVVLKECKLDLQPVGEESIALSYNEFRSKIMVLQELKATLQSAEFELESLRMRMQEQGKDLEIEPRLKISNLLEGGYDESQVGGEGQPSSKRRITSYIDTSTGVGAMPSAIQRQKRRTTSNMPPTQMDLKRPRKM